MKKFLILAILFSIIGLSGCSSGQTTATEQALNSQGTAESEHLRYGEPSTAGKLIIRTGYALLHDSTIKEPRWVSYHLTAAELNAKQLKRSDKFAPDPEIMPGERAELTDYRSSGYDRGHMCPNADQAWSAITMKECFYLSNMCPQLHSLNAGEWENLEKRVRTFVKKQGEAWIVDGPIFKKEHETIGLDHVWVPSGFFKVVIYNTNEGTKAIGYEMPHKQLSGNLKQYIVKIRDIEAETGLNFLSKLPQNEQDKLELVIPDLPVLLN